MSLQLRGEVIELGSTLRILHCGKAHAVLGQSRQTALRRLAQGDPWPQVEAAFSTRRRALEFSSWLHARGLLAERQPLQGWHIRLHGSPGLAHRLAGGLLELGVHRLTIVDDTGAALAWVHTELGLEPKQWSRVRVDRGWPLGHEPCHLVMVAGPGVEADRAVLADAHHKGVPALVLSAHQGAGTVGPLWHPDTVGCWRCLDLAKLSQDQQWSTTLRELTRRKAKAIAMSAQWVASTALLQLSAYASTGTCDLVATSLSWDDAEPGIQVQTWDRHPDCDCLGGLAN